MPLSLTKEQKADLVASIRRFMAGEIDYELSEIEAGFLLDYALQEIAPFAYNKGIEDAQKYLARLVEDLPGTCFEEPLTYWNKQDGSRVVRRKPAK
jgi:uncharacterized protein (DUF2164 family)